MVIASHLSPVVSLPFCRSAKSKVSQLEEGVTLYQPLSPSSTQPFLYECVSVCDSTACGVPRYWTKQRSGGELMKWCPDHDLDTKQVEGGYMCSRSRTTRFIVVVVVSVEGQQKWSTLS